MMSPTGLVANLLNRALGMYVKNFDPNQMSIGYWKGDIKLRNLELRKDALDQLHLPLNVIEGHLGELSVQIPGITNLRTKPVEVNIEDVFILAAPREDADYDPKEEEERAYRLKMEKLESAEMLKERHNEGMSQEEQQKQQSFVSSLSTAILDNLKVTVKNIHVRYEDSITDPGHPFAAGLTLREFTAYSTDGNWKPVYIQSDSTSTHKLAKLGALAIYWDTDDSSLMSSGNAADDVETDEVVGKFKALTLENDQGLSKKRQYILKPVSGQAGIELDKTGKPDRPHIKTRLFFDELGFVLDEDQYRDSLMLVDTFHYYFRHQENKKLQPKATVKEDPRAWWRFAYNIVTTRFREQTPEYLHERREDRLQYIILFKKKKKEEKLDTTETADLDRLEHKLGYEDLRFYRTQARNQLRKENVGVKKPQQQKQTWSSWIWGGASQSSQNEESQLDEEQQKQLYHAIDFDERKALQDSVNQPQDLVKLQLRMSLRTGSFTLKRDPHGKSLDMLSLFFDSFTTTFTQRPESFVAKVCLQGMRLRDGTNEASMFKEIINVKNAPQITDSDRIKELGSSDESMTEALQMGDDIPQEEMEKSFFNLTFEQHPLDGRADSALDMKLRAMEVVYNPTFVVETVKFFRPPERHMDSIGALMDSAGEAVEGIRKQTRAGLEFALEEHKTIDAHLDLQAPLIIVPDSVTQKSTVCLIMDAGHVGVQSQLADKEVKRQIQNRNREQYTDQDLERLESALYDKFVVKLDSTQVLIGPSIEATRAELETQEDKKHLHIIDRINMDFLVETSIAPKGTDLTKFRVTGNLPVLHASISDAKYKNLMKLLDVAIPKFDDETPSIQENGQFKAAENASESKEASKNQRPRSKSFQFSSQRHELLLEDEDDSDKGQDFKDAKSGQESQGPSLHQRNFEFKFVVEKLQGSLYRSDPDGKQADKLLAELIAEHFSLDFYQRAYDMVAQVGLKTLALEDHVEDNPLPEFKDIVSSEANPDQGSGNLFELEFIRVNKNSPEFHPKYEGFGMNLDVSVSTINLIVTRKTLLTLLDFVLITFTNSSSSDTEQATQQIEDGKTAQGQVQPKKSIDTEKMRIKARLKGIAMVLNNDGIRLATLRLSTASVALTMMGKAMRIGAKLGDLSLIDDINQGAAVDSPLRQLVTIQGQELADFTYETFDPDLESYPGHDSAIYLRSGSIKVNFVTEPFRKIMDFGVKFGRMQAIFNAARQAAANQAGNIQERATRMQFDIEVKTPIIVFPRMVVVDTPEKDQLTAYLGEIYAKNKFQPLDDSHQADTANVLEAGIRHVRLTSLLHYPESKSEELELLDKVDLDFNVTYVEHQPGYKRPDLEVSSNLSDINLRITSQQMKLMLGLAQSIPEAFATDSEEAVEEDVETQLPDETTQKAFELEKSKTPVGDQDKDKPTHMGPELGTDKEKWTKLDMIFKAGTVGVELIQDQADAPVGDLGKSSLSKFALNSTNIKLRMLSDGSLESELLIQSFTIQDTRNRETNRYRKIMSLINNDIKQQFMANVTISGGSDRSLLAILTVDSPRVILSLDYLFAVQAFLNVGLTQEPTPEIKTELNGDDEDSEVDSLHGSRPRKAVEPQKPEKSEETKKEESTMSTAFRVNLVDAQIILLANPAMTSSEAIVLGMKQAIVAQQHAMTVQVEKVGMFLCRMDRFDSSRLRILDDFSVATSLDVRSQDGESSLTNIQVDIEPLVLRLSLRDILLASQIASKATSVSGQKEIPPSNQPQKKITEIKGGAASAKRPSSLAATRTAKSSKSNKRMSTENKAVSSTIMRREQMNVHIGGMRVVLIGDLHELPILDWSVKQFGVDVRDWSTSMTAETSVDTFFNIYNFSKSAWEPLIEPWNLGFHMNQEQSPSKLSIDVFSRKNLELTLTSATIALMSKTADFLSNNEDVLSKPRGTEAPYRIRNYTGFKLNVWTNTEDGSEGYATDVEDGQDKPWQFEDPLKTRETLAPEGASGFVGVRLEGSGFDSVPKVSVNKEGESLFDLPPRKDKVLHRMLVEVRIGANYVKYVTFRSPLVVENNTQIPIELGVFSPEQETLLKTDAIAPGESRPAPIGAAYIHSLLIRPLHGLGYAWSNEMIFWKDLLKRPTSTITCKNEEGGTQPPFYYQLHTIYNKNNPLTSIYPYMKIRLSSPVEIQNLLPFDFDYRIYDKNTKKDWSQPLHKGLTSPVHVVNLSHLLLLNVALQGTPFKQSEFAIINSPDRDFSREKVLVVKDQNDNPLRLKLHYYTVPDSGGAFKVTIYSPYIILNRTGIELDVRSKAFMGAAKTAAGLVAPATDDPEHAGRAKPFMFSFPTDDQRNRALLKFGDSSWSKPQSFNAIGSDFSVTVPSQSGRTEMLVGVSVKQGEGKYNLTNVVTMAPRFVLKNRLNEDIDIREPGSSDVTSLKAGDLHPLKFLKQGSMQQMCLCFPGLNNKWSAPFYISNVGRVHVKLAKDKQKQQLIKVEILMEEATIFINLSFSQHWPFSIQNESTTEVMFYQANPNADEDDDARGSRWRPIRYRLPPRSIMPYAWDYPASKNKDLILEVDNQQRTVRLAEIGPQLPFRYAKSEGVSKSMDIDVVADGPKQTLVLSDHKDSFSLYRTKTGASTKTTSSAGFELKDLDTDVTFSANVRFTGVGLSLITKDMKELMYITLRNIELKFNESALYQTVNLTTKWIQIDNQLYGGIFPMLLYPSVVPKTGKELEAHPVFHTALTRVKDESYGVLYIKYFTILLQEMTIEVDEDFIFAMLDFIKVPGASWIPEENNEGKLCEEEITIPEPQLEESGQDIYFELLHLQPIQLDLSFVRTERINAEDTMATNNPFMFAANVMTMSLGNVNDAPLKYNALMLENMRITPNALATNIQSHYVQETLRQIHIVLGSADFLGNPVGLFNNVSSGVADIFYEPYQGLVMNDRPQDLGLGIAKGASSFVKKSVFGFSDSMAKFTGSISKGLAAASMDKEFQDQRRMSKSRNRPKHALYGVTAGGNAFANSMASGIGGLARHPLEGAEREGVAGFAKGVGKGLLGIATKPAIGAFDLASNLAEGVRNTTTVFDDGGLDRVRWTRHIPADGIVRPYSQREALGQFWLKTLDSGRCFNESYIAHLELPGKDLLVMLTYNAIMLVREKQLKTEWNVFLKDIQRITKERTGMNILLKGGRSGPFIPVSDEGSRNWLYSRLAVAVSAFNERWTVGN